MPETGPIASIPGFRAFELDLMRAVLDQLTPALDALPPALLTAENAGALPDAQGVYQLIHDGVVKYVGKTDAAAGLRARLSRHVAKFQQRKNISPDEVRFQAVQVLVLAAMDLETELVEYHKRKTGKRPEWNGSGFGANDPGRERETTNRRPEGFDSLYPIDIDAPINFISPGRKSVADVIIAMKAGLPYCFRYETEKKGTRRPHPDQLDSAVDVPPGPHNVRQLLKLVVESLPDEWQATVFPSHVILYKDGDREYKFGTRI